jgi:hypothetical protein
MHGDDGGELRIGDYGSGERGENDRAGAEIVL